MTGQGIKNPGIKTQYYGLPKPTVPSKWKCIKLTIPDYDDWETQFRSFLRYYAGSWFNYERDPNKTGRRIAQVWRYVESTIVNCDEGNNTGDDCCEPSQDIFDEFDADNIEDLYEKMSASQPFVGQVVMGLAAPGISGWLKCDGSSVNKADYPQLWQALEGKVSSDETTFMLPDFRNRIPMGTVEGGFVQEILETNGTAEISLLPGQLPPHRHVIGPHTHTTQPHTHTQNAHNHDQDSHVHGLTDPGHTHTVNTKQTSAAGAQSRVMTSNNSGTDSTLTSSSQTTGVSVLPQTATNQAATATNQNATVTVDGSSAYQSGETGLNEPIEILNPVIGVDFYVFAGVNNSEGC